MNIDRRSNIIHFFRMEVVLCEEKDMPASPSRCLGAKFFALNGSPHSAKWRGLKNRLDAFCVRPDVTPSGYCPEGTVFQMDTFGHAE